MDTNDIQGRLAFLNFGERDKSALRASADLLDRAMGPAMDTFYAKIGATPETAAFFASRDAMKSAQARQESHWKVIAKGEFSTDYAATVRRIGQAHARIGLAPRWYLGGYALVMEQLIRAAFAEATPEEQPRGLFRRPAPAMDDGLPDRIVALVKAMLLDADLAITVYIDEAEVARRQVIDRIGAALKSLSDGDLTNELSGMPAGFEQLQGDYNAALSHLREAIGSVVETTRQISTAADEMARASDDLARRNEAQASSLTETATATTSVSNKMATMLKNTEETNAITVRTGKDVEHQSEVMAASIAAMEEIESSTQKIGSIVGMIDEIAFQTNLLALNAGVEAARAGSQGAGFGFIANEVRELAQRSGNFARDIRALIADSSTQATRGVELVTDAGKSLERISTGVREIGERMGILANEVRSSAGGIGQINVALGEIDTVTQQNAAMAEEQTAATHSMMGETNRLAQIADGFRTNGGGSGGGERRLYVAGGRR